jgi:hypothetical protein
MEHMLLYEARGGAADAPLILCARKRFSSRDRFYLAGVV